MGGVISPLIVNLKLMINAKISIYVTFYDFKSLMCLHFYSFFLKIFKPLTVITDFLFRQFFVIFVKKTKFKENYFQFEKYTISNCLIC